MLYYNLGGVSMKISREKNPLQKIISMIKIVFYGQFAIISAVLIYLAIRFFVDKALPVSITYLIILMLLLMMSAVSGYFILRDQNLFYDMGQKYESQEVSYENVKELNHILRAQRHDFLNHIQVLYTLMELGEHAETSKYLDELYEDVGKLNANIKTKSVALNALLQAKSNEAERLKLHLELSVNTRFEGYNMPDWEMCRIIGNLIDNAFEATIDPDESVRVDIVEQIKRYEIKIRNGSRDVDEMELLQLFEPGYTSKSEKEGHGMGLDIVKTILKKYGNEIDMSYSEGIMTTKVLIYKSPCFDVKI